MENMMTIPLAVGNNFKFNDWANPPTCTTLTNDLQMAKPYHDRMVQKVDRWNDLLKVTGLAKPKKTLGRSSVQPKLVRRQAEWRYSALSEPFLSTDHLFNIKPRTFEDAKSARQNQFLANYQFQNVINRVKFIDDYVHSTVDDGTSVVRVGWKRVTQKEKQEVPKFLHYAIQDPEQLEQLKQGLIARNADPRGFSETVAPELKAALDYYDQTKTPTYAVQDGTQTIEVEKIIENKPTLDVIDIRNFYVDPSCQGDIDKANFAIISFETSQADLKKEPNRYKNLDAVNWENATPLTENEHQSTNNDWSQNFGDNLRKRIIAYEYWGFYDISGKGRLEPVVITWIGSTIIRMEKNPFPDEKLPFVLVPYLPIKRELFGEPDAEILEDNQAVAGAVMRGMIDIMGRSANGQQGFAKGMLDPVNRRRYDQGMDYEFNPNLSPANGLIEHKFPEIPQSGMLMLNLQNQDAEALTGVKSFSGGISGQAYGEVAAGIRGALDAASKREMAILRRLAMGIMQIGVKICAMNASFMSKEETIRITNEEFVLIKREELKGNFDLSVDIATAEVDDQKSKDLAFMLQTMGPNEDPEMRRMILAEIAELKRMPEFAHRIRTYKPEPDPFQEMIKQLELKKMNLEIKKLDSEIALNQAKAAEAGQKADKTNLDVVEQETGTTHVRRMEEMQAQAQGNQDLEVTKAIIKPRKPDETKPGIEEAIGFNALSHQVRQNDDHPLHPKLPLAPPTNPVDNSIERDALAEADPSFSLGSRFFEPGQDPALNPNINM